MSLLHELRAIIPNRRLTTTEAYVLAERQATAFLKLRGITSPAVPTEAITELSFITTAVRTPMRSSGATKWIKPRWVILLNGAEPAVRQRLSLCHEFKHCLDHAQFETLYGHRTTSSQRVRIERLCDYFAGCVLAPRPWLKSAWGNGIQDLADLAELFDMSQQAMQVRLVQCGLVDPYARCSGVDSVYFRALPTASLLQLAA